MKFGTLLKERLSDLPECESLFICYKQLKQTLKGSGVSGYDDSDCDDTSTPLALAGSADQASNLNKQVSALRGLENQASHRKPAESGMDQARAAPDEAGEAACCATDAPVKDESQKTEGQRVASGDHARPGKQ